jgi:large subunit ribosomal protein L25
MAEAIELKAAARQGIGKGGARAVRRENKLPGIVYGDGQAAEAIALDHKQVWQQYLKGNFLATVMNLDLDGRSVRVIPRDIQLDPVRDFPIHVDFMRLGKGAVIRVLVPVKFVGHDKSPGLKRGGVLNIVRREIEVYCPAEEIPEFITASLEGLEIGSSLHISAVPLPAGIKTVIQNRDFTVATLVGAKAEEEVKPAEAAAEGATAAAPAEGEAPAAAEAKPAEGGDKAAEKGADKGAKK